MSINFNEPLWIVITLIAIILVLVIGFALLLILSVRKLKKEHEFATRVLNSTNALVIIADNDEKILWCNKPCSQFKQLRSGEIFHSGSYPQPSFEEESSENKEHHNRSYDTILDFENSLQTKKGHQKTIAWIKRKNVDFQGQVQWIFTGIDITEKKLADKKLQNYQNQLRALANELSLSADRERRHIAAELHDRIGQFLSLTKLKMEDLRNIVDFPDLRNLVNQIDDLLTQIIQDTRSLIFEISPPILHELGLIAAVRSLAEKIQQDHNIEINIESSKETADLNDNMKAMLYRAVRELLFNIIKHAQANKAKISLHKINHHFSIEIEDNGVGFHITNNSNFMKGFGLFNIRESITHQGGYFDVASKPNCGTRIVINVPLTSQ
jgi:signal transduction histidine kinase